MKAIINGKVVTENKVIENGIVLFDEKICEVGENIEVRDCEIIDAKGNYVMPGFVDIHIHGYKGDDVCDASSDGISRMAELLPENGVTAWCPTTMTVSEENINASLDTVRTLKGKVKGAKILGVNLEGPYINPKKKGAQAEEHIKKPYADFVIKNKDIIKLTTVAPEMENGIDFVKEVSENSDVTVSIGHTDASCEISKEAVTNGASHITHLFNAMPPLNHRNPGVIGVALDDENVSCELIADTFHINPVLFKMLSKLKGDKLILITDCIRAGGLSDGDYTLGGQPVKVKGIECRLPDGTIAGSILTMNKAVYNFQNHSGIPISEAVNMASLYPARVVGEDDKIGSLEKGKFADITICDMEMNVIETFVNGEISYKK